MDYKKAVEVVVALKVISGISGISVDNIVGMMKIFKPDCKPIMTEALEKYKEFYDADLEERGRMFGYEIKMNKSNGDGQKRDKKADQGN